jgi:hypothetical protein
MPSPTTTGSASRSTFFHSSSTTALDSSIPVTAIPRPCSGAAEKVITQQAFGGYRANIVTYSIAKLAIETGHRLDLERMWRDQYISDATADALAEISRLVNKVITQPSGGTHVGEWTKKEACWGRVVEVDWAVPMALTAELAAEPQALSSGTGSNARGGTAADSEDLARVAAVDADTWFALSNWARETDSLQPWQRGLAYSMGRLAGRGSEPSAKQARQGVIMLEEAAGLGFQP